MAGEIVISMVALVAVWCFFYIFFKLIGERVFGWKDAPANEFELVGLQDVSERSQKTIAPNFQTLHSVFLFTGNLKRKAFLFTQLLNAICMILGFIVTAGMMNPYDNQLSTILLYIVVLVVGLWISWAACVKRTRDTGVNVWWVLALLVPPLNLAAMVFLLLVPTDEFKGRGL
ncbi:MAG: DUF805 domain-containing protein [Cypionkella sp.]